MSMHTQHADRPITRSHPTPCVSGAASASPHSSSGCELDGAIGDGRAGSESSPATLDISQHTVAGQLRRIFSKTDVRGRAQLVVRAAPYPTAW